MRKHTTQTLSPEDFITATLGECKEIDGCQLWQGKSLSKGYPMCHWGNKYMARHRAMWIATNPEEYKQWKESGKRFIVHHTCDNGDLGCMNPAHLEALGYRQHFLKHFTPSPHSNLWVPITHFHGS